LELNLWVFYSCGWRTSHIVPLTLKDNHEGSYLDGALHVRLFLQFFFSIQQYGLNCWSNILCEFPWMDTHKGFFIYFLESHHLANIKLMKLVPTWWNLSTIKYVFYKPLDRFLDYEYFLSSIISLNSSMGEGAIFNHRPIVLKIKLESESPLIPFKFNHIWMEEECFVSMVKIYWKPLDSYGDQSMMF